MAHLSLREPWGINGLILVLVFISMFLLVFVLELLLLFVSLFVFTFTLTLVFISVFTSASILILMSVLILVSVSVLNRNKWWCRLLERPVLPHLPSILHKHWASWAVMTSAEALESSLTWDQDKTAMHPHAALRQERLDKQNCEHSPQTLHVKPGLQQGSGELCWKWGWKGTFWMILWVIIRDLFLKKKKWVTSEVLGALWSPRIQGQDFPLPSTPGHCAHTHIYHTHTYTTHTHQLYTYQLHTHQLHTHQLHTHTPHILHTHLPHTTHISHMHTTHTTHTHPTRKIHANIHTHIPHTTHSAESLWQSSICDSVVLRTLAEQSQAC